ncbi:MAG: class I SAM-dependent methyltransferase [Clostridiales bacterium]|nr:class I SAM-dependent methyltransferase [Clostridiales bacterium]
MENQKIAPQSIQETLMLPLWSRAECTRRFPELLTDVEAVQIVSRLDYDYSRVAGAYGEYGIIASANRAYQLDKILRSYLLKHPDATIVNLGAGLDTTLARVDNGRLNWYDLDLPEIIAIRRTALGKGERGAYIAKSVFDYSWMDDIAFEKEKGIMFLAAGLFYYFHFSEIKDLVAKLAERFPGGELVFDSGSKTGVAISNRMVVKTGNSGAAMHFYVSNPKALQAWSEQIKEVRALPYYGGIRREIRDCYRKWRMSTKLNMFFGDLLKMTKLIRIYFK